MAGISVNKKSLEKYFRYLKNLDNNSKKKLIIQLTESIETESKPADLSSLFGAWEDERSSEEIIKEIREARVNNRDIEF